MLDTDLGQTYTYNKCSLFQKQLRLDVRIILCLMSSGVFVHTYALAFRKMSSSIAKAGPSKEAAPMLETPEKDRHKERFEEMTGEIFAGKSGSNSRGGQSLHLINIFSECIFFKSNSLKKV